MNCPTCDGAITTVETFDRWTPEHGWQFGVRQLRCGNSKQVGAERCPVVAITESGELAPVDHQLARKPVSASPWNPAKPIRENSAPVKRDRRVVRICVDCQAPSKLMKPRSDAQEEWRCKPCYQKHYHKGRTRTDR